MDSGPVAVDESADDGPFNKLKRRNKPLKRLPDFLKASSWLRLLGRVDFNRGLGVDMFDDVAVVSVGQGDSGVVHNDRCAGQGRSPPVIGLFDPDPLPRAASFSWTSSRAYLASIQFLVIELRSRPA